MAVEAERTEAFTRPSVDDSVLPPAGPWFASGASFLQFCSKLQGILLIPLLMWTPDC